MQKQHLVLDNTDNRLVKPVEHLRYKNKAGKWQLIFGFSDGAILMPAEEFEQDYDASTFAIQASQTGIRLP